MQLCKMTLTTEVDGQKSEQIRMGKLEWTSIGVRLTYKEENAQVAVAVEKGEGRIERRGDYSLTLRLLEGKTTQGGIGLGGSEGEISVYTDRVDLEHKENAVNVVLQYRLLFGEESQDMRLRIQAQYKGGKA